SEVDRALAVQVAAGAYVLDGVGDVGDVGKANGRAVAVANDDRLVIVGHRNLAVVDDVRGGDAVGNLAAWHIRILEAKNRLKICEGEAVVGKLGGIRVDADR